MRISLAVRLAWLAGLLLCSPLIHASRLDDALEASAQAQQFVDLSATPAYQYAVREEESTGNYSLDAIGAVVLANRGAGTLGNTNLVLWVNSADKIGGLDSAPELAGKAGLLWDTTDNPSDSASTSLLTLGLEQWFLDSRLSVGVGKFFPGQFFLLSAYTADNSNTSYGANIRTNRMILLSHNMMDNLSQLAKRHKKGRHGIYLNKRIVCSSIILMSGGFSSPSSSGCG